MVSLPDSKGQSMPVFHGLGKYSWRKIPFQPCAGNHFSYIHITELQNSFGYPTYTHKRLLFLSMNADSVSNCPNNRMTLLLLRVTDLSAFPLQ